MLYPYMEHRVLGQLLQTTWGSRKAARGSVKAETDPEGKNTVNWLRGHIVQIHSHYVLGTYGIADKGSSEGCALVQEIYLTSRSCSE